MKKLILLTLLISSTAYASDDHESGSTVSGTTTSSSNSAATATQQVSATNAAAGGAASSTTAVNVTNGGVEQVPSVYAPNLSTTLTETCMGSTSAGAASFGFGASFGSTWSDDNCVRRLDARQMAALGDIATAREMMCKSDDVREAAKRAGNPCKGDE